MNRKTIIGTMMCITALALCRIAMADETRKADPPAKVQVGNFQLSGPYTHENVTVYLIHGADKLKGKVPLTLDEALEQKKVIVYETKNVNELSIENVSDEDVFIQSGDIVKGGQQDRVVKHDIILSPKSGKLPLASYCVESGRWQQRGTEEAGKFSSSKEQLPTKDLKLATRNPAPPDTIGVAGAIKPAASADPSQTVAQRQIGAANRPAGQDEVWKKVAEAQKKLSMNASASVQNAVSASSLQLSLEHKKLLEAIDVNVKKLAPIIEGKNDVIGYAFAINGKVNSADIYASNAFFRKVWPKLVKATVVEALAEQQKDKKFEPVGIEPFKTFFADGEKDKVTEKDITARTQTCIRQTEKTLNLETRDKENKDKPALRIMKLAY